MYDELKENIYSGIAKYLDSIDIGQDESGIDKLVFDICDVIDEAFEWYFFASSPLNLDNNPQI